MKSLRIGMIVLAAALLAPLAHAALTLQLQIDDHTEAQGDSKILPPDRHSSLQVTLADKLIIVRSRDTTFVYDFATRRRSEQDLAAHTQVEYSLYDTAGFRLFELANRLGLNKALNAGGVKKPARTGGSEVDEEHNLALQIRPAKPLQESTDGGDKVFSFDGRELWRRSLAGAAASADDARLYAQFVRYARAGHPQVLAELADSKIVPQRIVLTTYNVGMITTTTIQLESAHAASADEIKVDHLAPRQDSSDPLDRMLDRAALLTPADMVQARKRSADELAAAWQAGSALDAWLGYLEQNLMGAELQHLTPEQRSQLQSQPAFTQLNQALGAQGKEGLTNAIKTLADLKPLAPRKAYVIDIFEANDRAQIGQPKPARDMLLQALSAHPFVAGAYKDLGDELLTGFDMPRAWRCWDVGRRLAPSFANFRAVDQLEHDLVEKHPEYF